MKGTGHTVEELIRLEAYLLSEKAGHPTHLEKSFWVQAEAIVHGRIAAMAPSGTTKVPKTPTVAKVSAKKPVKKIAPVANAEKQLLLAPEVPAAAKPAARKATVSSPTKGKEAAKSPAAVKAPAKRVSKAK